MHALSQKILDNRTLPIKPVLDEIVGKHVCIKPLQIERDALSLFEMSNGTPIQLGDRSCERYDADALIWRYMFDGPFDHLKDFKASLKAQVEASNALCLCVFDHTTNRQIGVYNLINNFPAHLKIELGGIWYSPIVQRTHVNTETNYLILNHLFKLGYRRIEWKCHSQNARSRKAALRLGFKFEGIQEYHFIIKNCNRDTAWFRLLDHEWPEVKNNLEHRLT